MNSDSEVAHGGIIDTRSLVAAFAERETAHLAAKNLRDEGFHKIWVGVTYNDSALKSEDESLGARIVRFFSGEADGASLVETLTRHGVPEAEAQRVERQLEPNDVILTVRGSNHPELAARIIEDAGGDVLAGESFVFTSIEWTEFDERPGSQLLGYEDPTEFARGLRVDDADLTRLRNERLLNPAVPTMREEIFIARFDEDDVEDTVRSRYRDDLP